MKYTAGVITISDKGYVGQREDTSGPALCEILKDNGFDVVYTTIVPDEMDDIKNELIKLSDDMKVNLVLTTGGTGFAKRDITPEATLQIIERVANGIAEAMRLKSMEITPRACLSRGVSGIRKDTLIINLPGSKKAASENINFVMSPIKHGIDILNTVGSSDCAKEIMNKNNEIPSMDIWLKEAKKHKDADKIGMYLTHNGVVRRTSKTFARRSYYETLPKDKRAEAMASLDLEAPDNIGAMYFSYDKKLLDEVVNEARKLDGIYYIRIWLNEGRLHVGDDIMYVLLGGDIRPHLTQALDYLVGRIKNECVIEKEL